MTSLEIFKDLFSPKQFLKLRCSNMLLMKNKKISKKILNKSNKKNKELGETKNSAKLVLFIFGLGPIIGITIFLFSKGFFDSPNI